MLKNGGFELVIKPEEEDITSDQLKRYELLSNIVLHESRAMWETSIFFLVGNTFLATILGTNIFNSSSNNCLPSASNVTIWLLSLLGLFISVFWYFSYNRTCRYYNFRMAQVRSIEPTGFNLFKGQATAISRGNTISIDGKEFNTRVLGFRFPSLKIINIIIALFILFFVWLSFVNFPWKVQIIPKNTTCNYFTHSSAK